MSKRIFKKRVLMIAGLSNGVNGVSTFYHNLFKVFDECDVCVDILNIAQKDRGVADNAKVTSNSSMCSSPVIGNVVNVWNGLEHLKTQDKHVDIMFPFVNKLGNFACPTLSAYARVHQLHKMLQENIYDAIFNNDNGYNSVMTLFQFFPFSRIMNVWEYTHTVGVFSQSPQVNFMQIQRYAMMNMMRNTGQEGYTVISQWDDDLTREWLKPNIKTKKIGMLLECEKFHEYQLPEDKKEDRVLYIGRFETFSKNPELWFKTLAETGLAGLVIVPLPRNAEKAREYVKKYNIKDCEIYHGLTFDEKMRHSARCKCFFIPSKHETFGYTVYENLNLMPVVAPDVYWAHMDKRELSDMIVQTQGEKLSDLVLNAVKNYSNAQVEEQYKRVIQYRNSCHDKWVELLSDNATLMGKEKNVPTTLVKLLEEYKTLPGAVKGGNRKPLGYEEIDVLYRHLDPAKIIQTKEKTYYGEILEDSKPEKKFSLDAFFACQSS